MPLFLFFYILLKVLIINYIYPILVIKYSNANITMVSVRLYFKYIFAVYTLVFQEFLRLKSEVEVNNNIVITIIIYYVFVNCGL